MPYTSACASLNRIQRHHYLPRGDSGITPPYKGEVTTSITTAQNESSQPTPRRESYGKAGFDVWVLTKGGLVCIATCRPVRTVGSHHPLVHAHLLGRYAQTSGARVYRYGPVTKCNPFLYTNTFDNNSRRIYPLYTVLAFTGWLMWLCVRCLRLDQKKRLWLMCLTACMSIT